MMYDYVQDISFITTYQCNSRCKNCMIWRESDTHANKKELDSEELKSLLKDPLFAKCPSIGLAGGEPTISPFFWKFLDLLPKDKRINISTNALTSKKLVDFLRFSDHKDKYEIQVSIDGIGETNDVMRGVKGAYKKSIALLEILEKLDVDRIMSFTINRLNYHELRDCYDLANQYGAEFCTRMAHIGGAYRNKENRSIFALDKNEIEVLDHAIDVIVSEEIGKPLHFPAKLVFMKKITDYYRGVQKDLPCYAFTSSMVIDLYGDVFPKCPLFMMKGIGNLREKSLSDIWKGEKAFKTRAIIDKLQCGGCWNDCQIVTNITLNREFLEKEYGKLKIAYFQQKQIPDAIDFTKKEEQLLLVGWYDVEGDADFKFRWTEREFSLLLPEGSATIKLFAKAPFTSGLKGLWHLDVIIEGKPAGSATISESEWRTYSIDLSRPTSKMVICIFKLNQYFCPKEAGNGDDGRKLGLAVNNVSFAR